MPTGHKRNTQSSASYSNSIGLAGIYVLLALAGMGGFKIISSSPMSAENSVAIKQYGLVFLAAELILLVVGIVVAQLLDGRKSKDTYGPPPANPIFMTAIAVPAFALLIPFLPFCFAAWSDATFDMTATPQAKTNREFVKELDILTSASKDYNKYIIEDFLTRGADINSVGKKGTALLIAIQDQDVELVKELLEKGADKNKTGLDGTTPLALAKQLGNQEIIQLLEPTAQAAQPPQKKETKEETKPK